MSPSNAENLQKWILEAETVWELEDAIGVPRGWNVPETLEQIETLNIKAAKKKEKLEALSPQLHGPVQHHPLDSRGEGLS